MQIYLDYNASTPIAPEVGMGAIRFSQGRSTTRKDVDAVILGLQTVLAPAES